MLWGFKSLCGYHYKIKTMPNHRIDILKLQKTTARRDGYSVWALPNTGEIYMDSKLVIPLYSVNYISKESGAGFIRIRGREQIVPLDVAAFNHVTVLLENYWMQSGLWG